MSKPLLIDFGRIMADRILNINKNDIVLDDYVVEAIPIEWIKEYASMKSFNDEMDCYWHFWEEDVLKMVADWEKENET